MLVHKTTEFKPREVEGAFDALGHIATLDLIQIKQDAGWRGLRNRPAGLREPPGWHPGALSARVGDDALARRNRGAALDRRQRARRDRRTQLLQGGKGTPEPIMLVRRAGHGGWEDTTGAILGFTKMNWNNDALYDRLPVTLGFASTLAHAVVHMTQLGPKPRIPCALHLTATRLVVLAVQSCIHGL